MINRQYYKLLLLGLILATGLFLSKSENSFAQTNSNSNSDIAAEKTVAVDPDNPPSINNANNQIRVDESERAKAIRTDLDLLSSQAYTNLTILVGVVTIIVAFFTILSGIYSQKRDTQLREDSKSTIDAVQKRSNEAIAQMNIQIQSSVDMAKTVLEISKSVAESASKMLENLQSKIDIVENATVRVEGDIKKVEADMEKFDSKFEQMEKAEEILAKAKQEVESTYQKPEELLQQCHTYSVEESQKIKVELQKQMRELQEQMKQLKNGGLPIKK